MSWQGLACALVETERVIQQEFGEAARAEPWEAAVISQAPEGKATIPIETVPPEKCRLGRDTSHRLDGVPHKLANMPELNHSVWHFPHATGNRLTGLRTKAIKPGKTPTQRPETSPF